MKRLSVLVVCLAAFLFLSLGCTTVQKGAAIGGLAGGVVGGIWGHNGGVLSAAEGAGVGTATGGLVGALVGDQIEEKNRKAIEEEIEALREQISDLEKKLAEAEGIQDRGGEKDQVIDGLKRLTDKLNGDLAALKEQLAQKEKDLESQRGLSQQKEKNLDDLKKQLDDLQVQLAQTPKGLTLTMLDSLLFKPGMAEITDNGKLLLDNVATIIKERFAGRELEFEGHTDNVPIKHSGWKSNWELGSARALSVLHYMVDNQGFDPRSVSSTSYGEFHPVAPNDSDAGRAQNRRAVIVVLPEIEIVKKALDE